VTMCPTGHIARRTDGRWGGKAPHKVDRRSGEGRGKSLDEGSTGPIRVENFGGGLCPAVDVSRLR
jgi:hypothetical protein